MHAFHISIIFNFHCMYFTLLMICIKLRKSNKFSIFRVYSFFEINLPTIFTIGRAVILQFQLNESFYYLNIYSYRILKYFLIRLKDMYFNNEYKFILGQQIYSQNCPYTYSTQQVIFTGVKFEYFFDSVIVFNNSERIYLINNNLTWKSRGCGLPFEKIWLKNRKLVFLKI